MAVAVSGRGGHIGAASLPGVRTDAMRVLRRRPAGHRARRRLRSRLPGGRGRQPARSRQAPIYDGSGADGLCAQRLRRDAGNHPPGRPHARRLRVRHAGLRLVLGPADRRGAAGGDVRRNPKGREIGFARRIVPTEAGRAHAMLAGRPTMRRRSTSTSSRPAGRLHGVLATNAVSDVQAAEIRRRHLWGVQYHPEFSLAELARSWGAGSRSWLPRVSATRWRRGVLRGRPDGPPCGARAPGLAWRHGLDEEVLDPVRRTGEIRRFVEERVSPRRAPADGLEGNAAEEGLSCRPRLAGTKPRSSACLPRPTRGLRQNIREVSMRRALFALLVGTSALVAAGAVARSAGRRGSASAASPPAASPPAGSTDEAPPVLPTSRHRLPPPTRRRQQRRAPKRKRHRPPPRRLRRRPLLPPRRLPRPAWPGQHLQGGGGLPGSRPRLRRPLRRPRLRPPLRRPAPPQRLRAAACSRPVRSRPRRAVRAPGRRRPRRRGRQGSAAPGPERHPSADVRPDRADPSGPQPLRHPGQPARAEAIAQANDIRGCRDAARKMRLAGVAMPPGFWRSRACGSTFSRRHSNGAGRVAAQPCAALTFRPRSTMRTRKVFPTRHPGLAGVFV